MKRIQVIASSVLLLAGASASPTWPRPFDVRDRCSFDPGPLLTRPDRTHFLGTSTADTLLAGPGAVKPVERAGHSGAGRARAIHGQVIRVEAFGGLDAERVGEAFARIDSREVVVVPWDYADNCSPTYWGQSAAWIEPGQEAIYWVSLRPDSLWTGDRPTFDVTQADFNGYPHGIGFQRGWAGTRAMRGLPFLSASELYQLYEALPWPITVGSSRVDLQACKLEYSIVSPK